MKPVRPPNRLAAVRFVRISQGPTRFHCCWETFYIFAYSGLVENPHLTPSNVNHPPLSAFFAAQASAGEELLPPVRRNRPSQASQSVSFKVAAFTARPVSHEATVFFFQNGAMFGHVLFFLFRQHVGCTQVWSFGPERWLSANGTVPRDRPFTPSQAAAPAPAGGIAGAPLAPGRKFQS